MKVNNKIDLEKMLEKIEKRKRNTEKAREEMFAIVELLSEILEGVELSFYGRKIRAKGKLLIRNGDYIDIERSHWYGYGRFGLYWNGEKLEFAFIDGDEISPVVFSQNTDTLSYVNFADFIEAVKELTEWVENLTDWESELKVLADIKNLILQSKKERG